MHAVFKRLAPFLLVFAVGVAVGVLVKGEPSAPKERAPDAFTIQRLTIQHGSGESKVVVPVTVRTQQNLDGTTTTLDADWSAPPERWYHLTIETVGGAKTIVHGVTD